MPQDNANGSGPWGNRSKSRGWRLQTARSGVLRIPASPPSGWMGVAACIWTPPQPNADIREGWGGFFRILRNGDVLPKNDDRLNPLTGYGTDRTGRFLWLVVVDGRQPGISEGMTSRELAEFMQQLGATEAIQMDGGGSSIMAARTANGDLAVLNSPSDRFMGVSFIRPLPNLLTIQEAETR